MISQITYAYAKSDPKTRFCQGDIVHDVSLISHTGYKDGSAEITEIILKYGVIISQDCDLEHDFNNRNNVEAPNQDKYLPNILLLPAYLKEDFKKGAHLSPTLNCASWGSDLFKKIQQNNDSRFHSLKGSSGHQIPDLIVDFKHLYTINRNVIYEVMTDVYLATIGEVFRENLSHRYSHYLSRIGLPEIN